MSIDDIIGAGMSRLLGLGEAWAATWTPAAGGTARACQLVAAESPDAPQQSHGQQSTVRTLDVYVRRSQVAAPAHGDQVVIAEGAHAGTWSVLGVERRDSVGMVVRLRLTTRVRTAGPTTREVLR
jgi:hypothetical protein